MTLKTVFILLFCAAAYMPPTLHAASVTKKGPDEFRPGVDTVVTDVDLSGIEASGGTPDDYETVRSNAAKGAAHAETTVRNPHGITSYDIMFGDNDWTIFQQMIDNHDAAERAEDGVWHLERWRDVELEPELESLRDSAGSALSYASDIRAYMLGNTNAWFEGTNYNVNAEQAANKVRYSPEPWEDVAFTPPSLQLYEIREGERKCVWDQRDWTVYYWNFKSAQLSNSLENAVSDVRTNCMRRGWARYTAVNGLDNPAPDTLWIDTPKVTLFAGHQWEKLVETGGAGYYTITGNGVELAQQEAESTFLTIKDFEGNACLTFRKTSSYLVYCECGTEIASNYTDARGRVTFHLTTDQQPTAEFSTVLDSASFVEQDEEGCPADCEWTGSSGGWDCHFLLKPGIASTACFARFKIMRLGENVVEHTVPIKLNAGIAFEQDGVTRKIRPQITGSTVNWVIVQ